MSWATLFAKALFIWKWLAVEYRYTFLKQIRFKLDIRSWPEIFIEYKDTYQYWVYNSCKGKIHITKDFFIDERHFYYWRALNNKNYSKDDCRQTDDAQFVVVDHFHDSEIASLMLSDNSFHLVRYNIFKQPEEDNNYFYGYEQDITSSDDQEIELSKPLKELLEIVSGSIKSWDRFGLNWAPWTLYSS